MATKEEKHNREQCSAVETVRAARAVAIWEQCGRKLRRELAHVS